MPSKSWYEQIVRKAPNRMSASLLSLILAAILLQSIRQSSAPGVVAVALLCAGYAIVLWMPGRLLGSQSRRAGILVLLWVLTASVWIGFDVPQSTAALMVSLIGLIAWRLPGTMSVFLAAAVIAADVVILLYVKHMFMDDALLYSIIHAGAFLLFWSGRMRREAAESRQRHFHELRAMHEQLEQAHRELQQAHRELEEATARSLRYAVLEERTRIARDIHDSIGHGLTSVIVQIQALPYMLQANAAEAEKTLSTVLEVARRCLAEVRTVVHQMAEDEADLGLIPLRTLVQQVQDQSGLSISLAVSGPVSPWGQELSVLLYRILQEALTNVIRHAEASRVEVTVRESGREVTLSVKDDGSYAGDAPPAPGFGLTNMRDRCESAGGTLRIQPSEPHGLLIIAKVPLSGGAIGGTR